MWENWWRSIEASIKKMWWVLIRRTLRCHSRIFRAEEASCMRGIIMKKRGLDKKPFSMIRAWSCSIRQSWRSRRKRILSRRINTSFNMLAQAESAERKTDSCILERRICQGFMAKKTMIEEGRRTLMASKEAKRISEGRIRSSRKMAKNDYEYSFVTHHW